ncbi:glutamine-rich protein 2 [Trichomycterus rosablanca]|uniref:glutamine-rich protein 2 n=1 Tax=Trichomycterus rosablanca TaxID=2290929 RepID=UPI002F3555C5
MSADITLYELLNASIGSPEAGAVNFTALRALLHALLRHLNIQSLTAPWKEADADQDAQSSRSGWKNLAQDRPNMFQCMEDKLSHIERQIAALERLPSGAELLSHTATGTSKTPVNDMWQLIQLRAKVEASEDGVAKCMNLIQDLMGEIHELQEVKCNLKNEVETLQNQLKQMDVDQMANKVNFLEQYFHQVEELKTAMTELKEKVAPYPQPEEFSGCVTWEVMQAALVNERQNIKKEVEDRITQSLDINSESNVPLNTRDSSTADPLCMADSQEGFLPQHGPQSSVSDGALPLLAGRGLSWISRGAERYPETVEALRDMGKLQEKHESLEARVELLEGRKADVDEVHRLGNLLTVLEERDDPKNVLEEVNRLKTLVDTEMANIKKVSELEHLVMDLVKMSESAELDDELAESKSTSKQDKDSISRQKQKDQLHLQLAYLRNAVQKLNEEMQNLKEEFKSLSLEQKSSSEKQIQDQLDCLRSMLEGMIGSSSMPSMSRQQESAELAQGHVDQTGQDEGQECPAVLAGQKGHVGQTCPSNMVDMVDQRSEHYEDQQSMVTAFITKQTIARTVQSTDINSKLTTDVQDTILQLQAKCENLHGIATHLMDDQNQKQSHIEHLYKAVEKLDEKKADREVVEMEISIKADKQALETKVSCNQFDTLTDQLNGMFQELLSKITGQEQDWHKVIERISTEMDCKLNRIELDPLKKQLEDRWRSIHKQLQAQPAPEHNDAAGFRKQLVARFHCISCNRPIDMITPGPNLLLVPSPPRLPSHKSNRPYTTYELDQVRQYSRSERIPEMANYSDLAMSRNCGGSHTAAYANRRYNNSKHITHLIPAEENSLEMPISTLQIQPEEVDILGLDGHIYKGRVNNRALKTKESRLPIISSKEGRTSISPI